MGITVHRLFQTVDVGSHIDNTVKYECDGCICEDVLCDGESVLSSGRISIVTASKFISFNFPSFENENACVYIGVFKDAEGKALKRTLQVIENASPAVGSEITKVTSLPPEGSQFEYGVPYTCQGDCSVDKLSLNGVPLENMPATRRQASPVGIAFFMYTPLEIIIRITSFSLFYCGVYQALFNTPEGPVTKSVLEIKNPYDTGEVDEEPEATADEGSAGSAADETVAEEAGDASASQVNGNSTDTNDTETDTTTTIVEEP